MHSTFCTTQLDKLKNRFLGWKDDGSVAQLTVRGREEVARDWALTIHQVLFGDHNSRTLDASHAVVLVDLRVTTLAQVGTSSNPKTRDGSEVGAVGVLVICLSKAVGAQLERAPVQVVEGLRGGAHPTILAETLVVLGLEFLARVLDVEPAEIAGVVDLFVASLKFRQVIHRSTRITRQLLFVGTGTGQIL